MGRKEWERNFARVAVMVGQDECSDDCITRLDVLNDSTAMFA